MNPDEAKVAMQAIRARRVAHRVAITVREDVTNTILTADKERIVALVGPSGVGKSAVIERVRTKLIEHFHDQMLQDPGFLPFIYLTTKTGHGADFGWKDLHARLLNEANEPLIRRKTSFPRLRLDGHEIATTRGLVTDEMGRAFESVVKHRRVQFVFFDEASAMIDAAVNKNSVRQFNILKSLAVQLGIVIVMIGAYDLLGLNRGNGQLIRRAKIIHMPRYKVGEITLPMSVDDEQADLDVFADSVATLAEHAPVEIEPDVLTDTKFIMAKSVGCFGLFRNWLDDACVASLTQNDGVLTREIFEAASLKNKTLEKLAQEAILGEQELADSSDDMLAKLLGMDTLRSSDQGTSEAARPNIKRPQCRVGERGPSRDPVGGIGA